MKAHSFGFATIRRIICGSLTVLLCIVLPCLPVVGQRNDSLNLSVRLQDPYNPDFELCTPVRVNEPFRVTWMSGKIRSNISGILHPPISGEYPLTLTVLEWASEQSNNKDSSEPKLKLEKPYGWGVIQSVVYTRRVVLSKDACK
jgi:hypothetical protein